MGTLYDSLRTGLSETTKAPILRLAHFDPTFADEYGNQVIDYLVLDAFSTYGPLIKITASEIKDHIKGIFKLDFAEEEINASAKRLDRRNMVHCFEAEKGKKPKFQVLPKVAAKIQDNLTKLKEMEDEVINNWKQELCAKYKEYPIVKYKIELMVRNLQLFTSKMFLRHGIECVAVLYPESPKLRSWLDSIETTILETLPKINPFIDEIMKLEIPRFFHNPDSKRKLYIINLFNSSFYWHLIQVDEKCSKLLQKVTRGQELYLDNNILYSLTGLHGANLLKSVHAMLYLAKGLGYELAVTTKTIDEFHESLRWQMQELKQKPPPSRELARIATENLQKDSFLVCYWDEFVKNGITIEEFISEKSHLKNILEGFEIKKTNKLRKDIEKSPELLSEESQLRSICPSDTSAYIITHDAFHRVFVNRIRQEPQYHFSEAVAWFLTEDSKLPVYDRVARKGESYLPFCITSDQWMQVNRPLLTRTTNQKEYEESFHTLVTVPFLRAMVPLSALEKSYTEVLGRLARYKKMSPQLALNITTDKHFMLTVASETDEQKIEEQIENKFVDVASRLQKEKEILGENVKQKNLEIRQKDGRIKTLEERMSTVEKKLEEAEKGRKRELKDEENKRKRAEERTKIIRERFQALKRNLVKWSIFGGGLLVTSVILWLTLFKGPSLDIVKNNTVFGILSQLLLIFGFLNIPLKRHWKLWLVAITPLIIALLTTMK